MSSYPVFTNISATLKNWSIKLNDLLTLVQEIIHLGQLRAWSPIFSGAGTMTFVPDTEVDFKYFVLFNTVFFTGIVIGTTGGTATESITFSLPEPVNADSQGHAFSVHIKDGTHFEAGYASASDDQITISKYGSAKFGIGSGREARVSGFYRRGEYGRR